MSIIDGPQLKTDASFLRAVHDDQWESLVSLATQEALQMLQDCGAQLAPLLEKHSTFFFRNETSLARELRALNQNLLDVD